MTHWATAEPAELKSKMERPMTELGPFNEITESVNVMTGCALLRAVPFIRKRVPPAAEPSADQVPNVMIRYENRSIDDPSPDNTPVTVIVEFDWTKANEPDKVGK
jgi:hypothetical protein